MLHGMPVEMSSPVKQLEQWWHYLLIWSKDSGINQNKYSPKISIRNQKSILSFLRKTLGSVTLWVLCSGYQAQDLEVASNGHPAAWRAATRILFSSIEKYGFQWCQLFNKHQAMLHELQEITTAVTMTILNPRRHHPAWTAAWTRRPTNFKETWRCSKADSPQLDHTVNPLFKPDPCGCGPPPWTKPQEETMAYVHPDDSGLPKG